MSRKRTQREGGGVMNIKKNIITIVISLGCSSLFQKILISNGEVLTKYEITCLFCLVYLCMSRILE